VYGMEPGAPTVRRYYALGHLFGSHIPPRLGQGSPRVSAFAQSDFTRLHISPIT
jgi:hypothetical protein